jgi:biopolymer transport protein ExbD
MSFTQREARSLIRRSVARVPEGEEIRHLNIMPMMDMMTILLVAFIYQAANSATIEANGVALPQTLSADELPEGAATLIITKEGVVVEGQPIVTINNGNVDPAEKDGGAKGMKIPRLTTFLGALRADQVAKKRTADPSFDPAKEIPELLVIADRTTPYHTLIEVMYSAKQKEAGYKRFRLIVQKSFPTTKTP